MKNKYSSEMKFFSIVIGVLSTMMIFFTALSVGESDSSFTGIQIVFGHEFVNLGGFASGQINFSILNFIVYLLPLAASMFLIFSKKGHLISTLLFGIAMVAFFLVPNFTIVTVTVLGNVTKVDIDWTYSIWLLIAALLSGLGMLIGLYKVYIKT